MKPIEAVVRSPTPTAGPVPAPTSAAHVGDLDRQLAVDEKAAARRTLIAIGVFAAILVPLLVIAAVVLQGPGVMTIHDSANLPLRVHVCGRNFQEAGAARTLDAIRSDGFDPVMVDTGPLAGCPGNACTSVGCTTVVYVRVGDDAYVSYTLLGGP
jgi:hypothetical protein